jgi:two-component system, NarL family, nitrate/nitrite response regulator NarL
VKRGVPTIIIEPRTLLREGLVSLLQGSNFKVVASKATIEELKPSKLGRPGLLIIGIAAGTSDDLRLLERLSPAWQDYTIIAVADGTGQSVQVDISQILRSADGYILNVKSRDVLLKSLELAMLDQKLVVVGEQSEKFDKPESEARQASDDRSAGIDGNGNGNGHSLLSERELDILRCLASGESNKGIARVFQIAESTVKIHLKSIVRKIQVQNRTQAAIWAIQNLSGSRGPPHMTSAKPQQNGSQPSSLDLPPPAELD